MYNTLIPVALPYNPSIHALYPRATSRSGAPVVIPSSPLRRAWILACFGPDFLPPWNGVVEVWAAARCKMPLRTFASAWIGAVSSSGYRTRLPVRSVRICLHLRLRRSPPHDPSTRYNACFHLGRIESAKATHGAASSAHEACVPTFSRRGTVSTIYGPQLGLPLPDACLFRPRASPRIEMERAIAMGNTLHL
ncbi:hypothetical protein K488DRAFT_87537 [Vararia minispora EC-137]|uniref:Uncharacterized protein n=1 Tax=Vararia minispora EC-137 TaxID=1314806 RepID=A0ACB8QG66_9AGAM|nr:hypothetical protein K488DRAFT_87537 [Vararia minispora EC-137]